MVGLICYRLKSRTVTIDDMVAVISRNEVGKEFEPLRTRKYGQMKPVQLMLALYHEQKAMVNFWVIVDFERYLFPAIDYAPSIGVKQIASLALPGCPPQRMWEYARDCAQKWQILQ